MIGVVTCTCKSKNPLFIARVVHVRQHSSAEKELEGKILMRLREKFLFIFRSLIRVNKVLIPGVYVMCIVFAINQFRYFTVLI